MIQTRIFDIFHGRGVGGEGILLYFGDPKIILIDTDKYGENPIFPNVVTLVNFLTGFQTDPLEFETWRETVYRMKNGRKRAISRR